LRTAREYQRDKADLADSGCSFEPVGFFKALDSKFSSVAETSQDKTLSLVRDYSAVTAARLTRQSAGEFTFNMPVPQLVLANAALVAVDRNRTNRKIGFDTGKKQVRALDNFLERDQIPDLFRRVFPLRCATWPALKELEEWFDAQKEIRAIAKLDPFFERTSKLASRRLKRELERRGTLGRSPLALEPDPSLKRMSTEESGSDLFRSDGLDAAALSYHVKSPQSVVQGCPTQGSAVWPGEKES
jgi:hypothetical protein